MASQQAGGDNRDPGAANPRGEVSATGAKGTKPGAMATPVATEKVNATRKWRDVRSRR